MAYRRINTQDNVTYMNKVLYDNLQDGIDTLFDKTKYATMSADDLSENISGIGQISDLVSKIPDKCILYASIDDIPVWFPAGVPTNGCVLMITRHSSTKIIFSITNVIDITQNYIAGYNGSTFTGWHNMSAVAVVVPASLEE